MMAPKLKIFLSVFIFTGPFLPQAAYAYIDPGSGNIILTVLIGIAASITYTLKKYFYKIRQFINFKKKQASDSED